MTDIRKIVIIFVIAVLFTIFVFSAIDAIYQQPRYDDYCQFSHARPLPYPHDTRINVTCPEFVVPDSEIQDCNEKRGFIDYEYDSDGCIIGYSCNTCQVEYDKARQQHNMIVFIISSILGLIAIIASLYLPVKSNALHEWIGTGFMLGGLFTLFFGTVIYFSDMSRFLRPIVIFAELLIIVYLSYKKLGDKLLVEPDVLGKQKRISETSRKKSRKR